MIIDPLHAVILLATYLLGSISTAVVTARLFGLPDPRMHGSNNPGATNMLRLGGKLPAGLTLIGDVLKGLVPTLLASVYFQDPLWLGAVGLAAFLGHVFSIFLKFQGGKGVATYIGVLLALNPMLAACFAITWGLVAGITRYSSLSGLVAAIAVPTMAYMVMPKPVAVALALMSVVIFIRHKDNILRLIQGRESRLGKTA